jgi:UDPglucose--hexose-1-phosphate uridylyltransferase
VIDFTQLDDDQVALVFQAYRDRITKLRPDSRLAYAQIFKNSGAPAGASLEHAHSQLIATSVVPTQVQGELGKSRAFHQKHGRCVFCAMLREELAVGLRIVTSTDRFVGLCPFASQFPYETWILPRSHGSHFEFTGAEELVEIGVFTKDIVRRMELVLGSTGFNYLLHTSPFDSNSLDYYHWHVEIFPRVTKTAGFEWGAGDYINTVCPEDAARTLRSISHH